MRRLNTDEQCILARSTDRQLVILAPLSRRRSMQITDLYPADTQVFKIRLYCKLQYIPFRYHHHRREPKSTMSTSILFHKLTIRCIFKYFQRLHWHDSGIHFVRMTASGRGSKNEKKSLKSNNGTIIKTFFITHDKISMESPKF